MPAAASVVNISDIALAGNALNTQPTPGNGCLKFCTLKGHDAWDRMHILQCYSVSMRFSTTIAGNSNGSLKIKRLVPKISTLFRQDGSTIQEYTKYKKYEKTSYTPTKIPVLVMGINKRNKQRRL